MERALGILHYHIYLLPPSLSYSPPLEHKHTSTHFHTHQTLMLHISEVKRTMGRLTTLKNARVVDNYTIYSRYANVRTLPFIYLTCFPKTLTRTNSETMSFLNNCYLPGLKFCLTDSKFTQPCVCPRPQLRSCVL